MESLHLKNSIVIQAGWSIDKIGMDYYLPQTHHTYLSYIAREYDEVILLSSTCYKPSNDSNKVRINYENVVVKELPFYVSFLDSIRHFNSFRRLIKSLSDYQYFYCRVPDPFSWMPKLFFRKKCRIHFVGDGLESIWNNQYTSFLNKVLQSIAYLPDFFLTIIACYGSIVYTNGNHIAKRLSYVGINAIPLISSTLNDADFTYITRQRIGKVNLLFLGYLSPHKGIKTILELVDILELNSINFQFNIVGDGQMMKLILDFIDEKGFQDKIFLHGHLNDRNKINNLIDKADFFIFPSKSEGSPRVILEVMSRNLPVISTPVGSLPYCFSDGVDIMYADFDDPISFYNKLIWALDNSDLVGDISKKAFEKVKSNYTQELFLSKIFK